MKLKSIFMLTCSMLLINVSGYSLADKHTETSIMVINPIVIPSGREEEALAIWDKYANYFKEQPGFIGTKLHRSLDPKAKFHLINVAKWKSAKDFNTALHSEKIKKLGSGFPKDMPYYPSIYQIIRDF